MIGWCCVRWLSSGRLVDEMKNEESDWSEGGFCLLFDTHTHSLSFYFLLCDHRSLSVLICVLFSFLSLSIHFSDLKTIMTTTTTTKSSKTKVFVGNLSFKTKEQDLADVFKTYGTVYVEFLISNVFCSLSLFSPALLSRILYRSWERRDCGEDVVCCVALLTSSFYIMQVENFHIFFGLNIILFLPFLWLDCLSTASDFHSDLTPDSRLFLFNLLSRGSWKCCLIKY
jgi:hypothetical protein